MVVKLQNFSTKNPKSTLLDDNTRGLRTTKQANPISHHSGGGGGKAKEISMMIISLLLRSRKIKTMSPVFRGFWPHFRGFRWIICILLLSLFFLFYFFRPPHFLRLFCGLFFTYYLSPCICFILHGYYCVIPIENGLKKVITVGSVCDICIIVVVKNFRVADFCLCGIWPYVCGFRGFYLRVKRAARLGIWKPHRFWNPQTA